MNLIALNFLKINPTQFEFAVFRQLYDQKAIASSGIFVYKLPAQIGEESYNHYAVTFDPKDGFERFLCNQNTNNDLTRKILWTMFIEKLNNVKGIRFVVRDSGFERSVDFIIESMEYGDKIVVLSPYYLRVENLFGWLVDFRFRKKKGVALNREIHRLSLSLDKNYRSNKDYYSDKHKILRSFIDSTLSTLFPTPKFGINFEIEKDFHTLRTQSLSKKEYLFRNENSDASQFQGIRKWGPYKPVEGVPQFIFLFEEKYKAFGTELFLAFAGKANPGTFSGLELTFGIKFGKENIKRFSIPDYSKTSLDNIIAALLAEKQRYREGKVIGIFIEQSKYDSLPPPESPYYYFKYHLTKHEIPLQVITYERISDPMTLKWASSNICLQIFAKLGGIPWLVRPKNEDCVIIGIGSAHEKGTDGRTIKYLAYSVLLDSSGLYKKLDILADEKNRDSYVEKLKENLLRILREPDMESYKKVALHLPFKMRGFEIASINEVLSQIRDMKFYVLKVNDESRFFGFSDHNTLVPYESTFIRLSKDEYLIWFEGLAYGKENVYRRTGNPVHIQFLRDRMASDSDDLSYLQDVLNLSGANWRGFNAKQLPVSIFYAKIVADFSKAFELFEDFDDSIFQNNFPWFL